MPDKAELGLKTYKWNGNSTIAQIDVRGDGVAYLHASQHARALPELRKLFEAQGLATSSDARNNDPAVLRLSGFGNINEVITLLQNANATEGSPSVSEVAAEHAGRGIGDLKANSLRASAVLYMLGNALYIMSGVARQDKDNRNIGIAMAVGDASLMAFGGKDDKKEFDSLIRKLKKHYEETGIEIPQGAAINAASMAKPGGFLEQTYNFIHENINIAKCLAEVAGGAYMIKAGITQNNPGKKAAGAVLIAGFGAAALIKEKKYDPEKYEKAGAVKKTWMKIQSQPLLLAGASGLINNAFNIAGTIGEVKGTKTPGDSRFGTTHWKWDAAGVCAMMVANIFYSISKKTTGGNIKSVAIVDDVYGLAAQVLGHMDAEAREIGIRDTAEYLGQRIEIKDTKEQIEANLRREIGEYSRNRWFETGHIKLDNPVSIGR